MANHGVIAVAANLDKAMWLAVELETIARQYYLPLVLCSHVILTDEEIAEKARGFSTYCRLPDKDEDDCTTNAAPRRKKNPGGKR